VTEGGESSGLIVSMISIVLGGLLLVLAMTALGARALFVASVTCALMAAIAALALLANGAVLAAIGLVAFGAMLFPAWLLGGMLLSANAVKENRRRAGWLALVAALVTAAVIVAVTPELAATRSVAHADPVGLPALLATVVFVAGVSVFGLIGYGERGALERRGRSVS